MSYCSLTYHFIFGTHERQNVINISHERELYKYIYDFCKERGCFVRRIGGMPDHIHLLCDILSKLSVAEFIKLLKTETSKFMRVNPHFPNWQGWAEGYAAFTVDVSLRQVRVEYIMNQKNHHQSISFSDELRNFLIEAGIDVEKGS